MRPICDVPGCGRPFYAHRLCNAHYAAQRAHPGETLEQLGARSVRARTDDEMRALIASRVTVMPNGCHEWQGARDRHGYGNIRWKNRLWGAHRLAFHLFVRPVVKGEDICHACDNPPCCNVEHLFAGTHHENMLDAKAKDRMAGNGDRIGERNGRAILTEADVRAIRADPRPASVVAAIYGIAQVYVYSVRSRRVWKHVA